MLKFKVGDRVVIRSKYYLGDNEKFATVLDPGSPDQDSSHRDVKVKTDCGSTWLYYEESLVLVAPPGEIATLPLLSAIRALKAARASVASAEAGIKEKVRELDLQRKTLSSLTCELSKAEKLVKDEYRRLEESL